MCVVNMVCRAAMFGIITITFSSFGNKTIFVQTRSIVFYYDGVMIPSIER